MKHFGPQAFWLGKLEQAIAIVNEYNDANAKNEFYLKQINEAERRGLTEFDRDKFMVPRKKKNHEDQTRELI